MKKLLLWLMAMMMLCMPAAAAAEGSVASLVTMDADAERLEPLIKVLTGTEDADLADGIEELLEGVLLKFVHQDDAVAFSLKLKDEELLSMAAFAADDAVILQTNLLPGYALTGAAAGTDAEAVEAAWETLDLTKIAESAKQCLDSFLTSAEVTEAQGSFVGDAYHGGVRRRTISLDDRELSQLLESLLACAETDPQINELATAMGLDFSAALLQCREALQDAARENIFRYQISAVYNAADELIGLSGTAVQGDMQISTLSVGLNGNYVEIVWGYGYHGVNYYIRAIVMMEETDGVRVLSGLVDVLADPTGLGYGLVSSLEAARLEEHVFTMTVTQEEACSTFDGGVRSTRNGTEPVSVVVMASGQMQQNDLDMTAALYWDKDDSPALVLNIASETAGALRQDLSGCEPVNLDTADEETAARLNEALEDSLIDLGMKLFRLIPAELVFLLMQ